jgi:hypothetical protein
MILKMPVTRHLADYLRELIGRLERWEPDCAAAIRATAGDRRARIVLGDEAVRVRYKGDRFIVRRIASASVTSERHPCGSTDRRTVVAILAGFFEMSEAISEGRLDLSGGVDDVIDMCAVIEMLIDASTRIPELQQLAQEFRADPKTGPFRERRQLSRRRTRIKQLIAAESDMLRRYGLT